VNTNVKKLTISNHPLEKFDIRQTTGALVISESSAARAFRAGLFSVVAIPMLCFAFLVGAFALRRISTEGIEIQAALLLALAIAALSFAGLMFAQMRSSTIVMITRESIHIISKRLMSSKHTIATQQVESFPIIRDILYDDPLYLLGIEPPHLYKKGHLFASSSRKTVEQLKMLIEAFLKR
jgi:hypothetical protein